MQRKNKKDASFVINQIHFNLSITDEVQKKSLIRLDAKDFNERPDCFSEM
jgi:hypothetical protein